MWTSAAATFETKLLTGPGILNLDATLLHTESAWAFQVTKLSNTTLRSLKVVSQDVDFPTRLRFKLQSRSLCLWDVNSTHLVFERLPKNKVIVF